MYAGNRGASFFIGSIRAAFWPWTFSVPTLVLDAPHPQGTQGRSQPHPGVHFTYRTGLHRLVLWFGFYINNSISMAEGTVRNDVIKWQLLGFQTIFLQPRLRVPGILWIWPRLPPRPEVEHMTQTRPLNALHFPGCRDWFRDKHVTHPELIRPLGLLEKRFWTCTWESRHLGAVAAAI